MCVRRARMPRKHFISTFPDNETNPHWLRVQVRKTHKWGDALKEYSKDIKRLQQKLEQVEEECMLSIGEIKDINKVGVSILLVEQNVRTALATCKRIYIMEKGIISYEGTSAELKKNPEIIHRYLGVSL